MLTREEALSTWLPFIRMDVKHIPECKEALDIAIEALKQGSQSPCDVCRYNPPSSMDEKPCAMCPAEGREE